MSKLYPPIIEGTLPAFYDGVLKVPFQMNRAVSKTEVDGFQLKIKTVTNSTTIETITSTNWNDNYVTFNLSDLDGYKVGQYYKIQIAYINNGIIGYYSSVGVAKYTHEPEIYIDFGDSQNEWNHVHQYSYTGVYNQGDYTVIEIDEDGKPKEVVKKRDSTEKVYSYRFDLYDQNYDLVLTSGDQIHNSNDDIYSYESRDTFQIDKELDMNKRYYLQYVVTTTNKMIAASPSYAIIQQDSVEPSAHFELSADARSEEEVGAVILKLTGAVIDGVEERVSGQFKLLRSSEEDNYSEWNELFKFNFLNQLATMELYRDYTVKQGVNYKYAVVQYNGNIVSNKIESNIVASDFEHMFLYDGERQLKIKFNPKVSSFKTVHLESKVDTIGSKHPYIFRNGNIGYKEFPISGLISFQMDDEKLFYEKELKFYRNQEKEFEYDYILTEINREEYEKLFDQLYIFRNFDYIKISELDPDGTNYSPNQNYYLLKRFFTNPLDPAKFDEYPMYQMQHERDFKLDVLDWLNNGKPKLFRSPAEGNYIVRLMNVSLSPTDQLARMLHTFSGMAYEIAPFNFKTIQKYNFVKTNEVDYSAIYWETITLSDISDENILPDDRIALSVKFEDLVPGEKLTFDFFSGERTEIVIGATGSYSLDLDDLVEIKRIGFTSDTKGAFKYHQGTLTYAYRDNYKTSFDKITSYRIYDRISQYFGNYENVLEELVKSKSDNIESELKKIYFIRAFYRKIREISNLSDANNDADKAYYIYKNNGKYYDLMKNQIELDENYSENGFANHAITLNGNNKVFVTKDNPQIFIDDLDDITSIGIGENIALEICYQVSETAVS